jgi:hypothetical protein
MSASINRSLGIQRSCYDTKLIKGVVPKKPETDIPTTVVWRNTFAPIYPSISRTTLCEGVCTPVTSELKIGDAIARNSNKVVLIKRWSSLWYKSLHTLGYHHHVLLFTVAVRIKACGDHQLAPLQFTMNTFYNIPN